MYVCREGASAMVGKDRGFTAWVKQKNSAIEITHCCFSIESLMIKVLLKELSNTMKDCIHIFRLHYINSFEFRNFLMAV